MNAPFAVALHGGAGVHPDRDYKAVEAHLAVLVADARRWLESGAAALDVVERAVAAMEASGLYVAGRGAAPNIADVHEFDASIMDGGGTRGLPRAGAVAAIRDVESPVAVARLVMDRTAHVLLAGDGAIGFAREQGAAAIGDPATWFRMPVGVTADDMAEDGRAHGTVGAVALDVDGRLAAATSTGGTFGKRPGRVGDTPLPGAGTWADAGVAASCTGIGEAFILAGGAGEVAARVRLAGQTLITAADAMLARVAALGGDGGVIAINAGGDVAMRFNSAGMKRAAAGNRFATIVAIT